MPDTRQRQYQLPGNGGPEPTLGDTAAVPDQPLFTPPGGNQQQRHRWRVQVDYTAARSEEGASCITIDGRALTAAEAHELILDLQPAADQVAVLRQLMERRE